MKKGGFKVIEQFHVFGTDEYIGEIIHDSNGDKLSFEPHGNGEWLRKFEKYAFDTPLTFKEVIYGERIFPPERVNARELLHQMGMLEYNPWEILKFNHMTSNDFFWMHDELKPEMFWTHHPLAILHWDYEKITGLSSNDLVPFAHEWSKAVN